MMRKLVILIVSVLAIVVSTGCQSVTSSETYEVYPQTGSFTLEPLTQRQGSSFLTQTLIWNYDDITWHWRIEIPEYLYSYYKSLQRAPQDKYYTYVSHPFDDEFVGQIATQLENAARSKGYDRRQIIEFFTSFVRYIPYTTDYSSTNYNEYPRYPIETLAERRGDCEDTSILLSSILGRLGIESVLVYFPKTKNTPGHFAIAVKEFDGMYGVNWNIEGNDFYYIDTVNKNMGIGVISAALFGKEPTIITLKPVACLSFVWRLVESEKRNYPEIEISVSNIGRLTVDNVLVRVGFESQNEDDGFASYEILSRVLPLNLYPGTSTIISLDFGETAQPVWIDIEQDDLTTSGFFSINNNLIIDSEI